MTNNQIPNEEEKEEFPSNRISSRVVPMTDTPRRRKTVEGEEPQQEKRVKKTIKGHGVRRKKTMTQSIAQTFFGDDARNVGNYVLWDVLLPAAKTTIQEMVSTGIEMLLFGETRSRSGRSNKHDGRSVVSYGSFYRGDNERSRPTSRGRYNFDSIVFKRGDEAADVLESLCDSLEKYDQVTVSDFYELAGVDGATWADENWGWENLSKAYCTRTRGGYVIVLPKPVQLD